MPGFSLILRSSVLLLLVTSPATAGRALRPNGPKRSTRAGGKAPRTLYVDPRGDDSNDGLTPETPWATIQRAVDRRQTAAARAGDTILLANGTWTTNVGIDCGPSGNANSGEPEHPVTLRALEERQALIMQSSAGADVLAIAHCSYWNVEGLHIEGLTSSVICPRTVGILINVSASDHINVRRNIVAHLNADINIAAIFIGYNSDVVLIEENEIYSFGRGACPSGCNCNNKAIQPYRSTNVEIRRNYVNQRSSQLLEAINPYPAGGVLVENNIVEHSGVSFSVDPDGYATDYTGLGANNLFFGNISIGAGLAGFFWADRCMGRDPCLPPGDFLVEWNHYLDNISVNSALEGVYDRGAWRNTIEHFTDIASSSNGYVYDVNTSENGATITATAVANFLSIGRGEHGFHIAPHNGFSQPPFNFSCDSCITDEKDVDFVPALPDPHFTNSGRVTPTLIGTGENQCIVYVPGGSGGANPTIGGESSNMAGAGSNGEDIGANVVYRYENGVLTDQPLWDPVTGSFPCGAIVPGLNDVPGDSCFDVHERLHVGTHGCPIPSAGL